MAKRISRKTSRAIRKYGPVVNRLARSRYGISGQQLLADVVAGESSDNPNAVSPAGARGRTQFMPGTRDSFIKAYGIDPWGSADDAVHAAALHLTGALGHGKGLEGYNPGDPSYPKYILSQNATLTGYGPRGGGSSAPRYRTETSTTPGVDNSDTRKQLKLAYLQNRHDPNALLDLAGGLQGAQDVAPTTTSRQVRIPGSPHDRAGNDAVQVMKAAAEHIDEAKVPYLWGGGHSKKQKRFGPVTALDCSGAVSRVLGIDPMVSGDLAKWGKSGRGKRVTVYANGTHTLMEIDGHVFGTSAQNKGGGAGWIPKSYFPKGYFKNFTARHPPGM